MVSYDKIYVFKVSQDEKLLQMNLKKKLSFSWVQIFQFLLIRQNYKAKFQYAKMPDC